MAIKTENRAITFEHEADVVTFKSANGDSFSLNLLNLSADARTQAVIFGVARKVTNAAALLKGSTIGEKWASLVEVATRLHSGGNWNGEAKARGGNGNVEELCLAAMARVYSQTPKKSKADVEKHASKKGITYADSLKMWAASGKVAKAILELKAERAAKAAAAAVAAAAAAVAVDLNDDDMMDELEEDEDNSPE